ncbi:hypothetical protein JVT61DRAFT_15055 [Boletus reticuloceps]|uniref:C2H2-type domain-containing protein n=1 Tax=Boletus reticuloceps TaxID=495285 RepID=A0A8I2YV51_9AGAM|nr:hypothetical protein JVT61DRAFT_15055 [Boletus reticuloceps]
MAKPRAASVNCPTCGKTISRKCDLPRHMKIHMPDKEEQKLPCPYQGCPFRAFQKSALKTHLNVHTGERPHKCPTQGCQFRTGDPGSLCRHRKDMHENQSRRRSGSHRPACTRKTTRRRRRMSPYPCSSLLLDDDDYIVEGSKNTSPAYGTELTIKRVQVNDTPLAFPENVYLVPYGSRVLIAPETPVADHAQLLVPDQGDLSIFGFESVAPRASHIAVDDGSFDGFRAGFNNWLPGPTPVYTGPSFPTPADHYTTDGTSLPTLASLSPGSYSIDTPIPASLLATFPLPAVYTVNDSSTHILPSLLPGAHEMTYAVDNSPAPLPGSWTLPAYKIQSTVNNASLAHEYDGYATEALSRDQADLWQPNSIAVVGTYPQPQAADFDQGYLHATSINAIYDDGETSRGFTQQELDA